ncbi:hypothetical protein ACHRVW_22095 [Flavobacterium collinsii]|uniref:hypothetical protein n=1 Tax=Flavobacterium collinsii TaxID=1114861 RepID=UPI00375813F4
MTFNEYLANLGFGINPFQYSNADKEIDIIGNYFIKPDYFEDIWGNPYNPVSNIVYAPRGGGKTAQRIMVEKRAKESDDILTITYTNHDLSAFSSINEITLSYHLTYLNRLLLLSFLIELMMNLLILILFFHFRRGNIFISWLGFIYLKRLLLSLIKQLVV